MFPNIEVKVLVFTAYARGSVCYLKSDGCSLQPSDYSGIERPEFSFSDTCLSSWYNVHQQNLFVQPREFQGSTDRYPDLSCWLHFPEIKFSDTRALWSTCSNTVLGAVLLWFVRSRVVHLLTNESQTIFQNMYPWAESCTPAQDWNVLAVQRERHFALVVKRGSEEHKFPNWTCRRKFSASECNYPNWITARILEFNNTLCSCKSTRGSLMTASGQQASHHVSKIDINQIRSVDISVCHITNIADGLWLQPSGSGRNRDKQPGKRQ